MFERRFVVEDVRLFFVSVKDDEMLKRCDPKS